MAVLALRPASKLMYPGGYTLPGFNPGHVVGRPVTFSSVAVKGNHVNLLTGKPGTIVGSPTSSLTLAGFGTMLAEASSGGFSFANIVPATNRSAITQVTLAAIVTASGIGAGFDGFFSTDNGNSSGFQINLGANASDRLGFQSSNVGVVNITTASGFLTLPQNVSHFVALSNYGSGVTSQGIITNLQTGQITTGTFVGQALLNFAGSGSYCVNNLGTGNSNAAAAIVHATMAVERSMSAAELMLWASDPWSFWYPQNFDLARSIKTSAAAGFLAAWARGSNLPVIGTGTY